MMPDFGTPVAANITVGNPNQGLSTLSNLMGLQQQKQGIALQAAELQKQNELKNERQILQNMFATGQDPDNNPIKDAQGEIDVPAFSKAAFKFLPLMAPDVTQQAIHTMDARLKLNDATRQLGQNYRNDLSGIVRSAIGTNQSPQDIGNALDAYGQKNPQAGAAIARAKSLIGVLSPNMPQAQRDQALMHLAQEFQPSQTTEQEQAPTMQAYTDESGNLATRQVNPLSPVPMGQVGPTVKQGISPSERTSVNVNTLTGQPYTVIRNPSGVGASIGGMGGGGGGGAPGAGIGGGSASTATGWPKLGAFPTPQQANSASLAAQEADATRNSDSNPVTGYAPTHQVYSNLLDLVSKNPAIGPHSQAWNQLTSILTPLGASPNSSMQEIGSYLDRLALQNAGAAGLSTDAARQMSAVAAGTTEMNPQALLEKLRFGAATLEAAHAYRQGLDKVIGTDNSNPIAKRAFDAAWSQNADINAFRLLSAKQMGDKEGYLKALQQIQNMPPAQRAAVKQKMKNLNMLVNGQQPQ